MISIKTLKDSYLIDDNLEDKYLISNIQKAQDFLIKPIMGELRYKELLEDIEIGTLIINNKIILDKIEPIIAYYVMSEVVYSTAYKFKNQGLEDGVNGERFNELVKISKKYLLDSQHYQQLLSAHFQSLECKSSRDIYKTGLYVG